MDSGLFVELTGRPAQEARWKLVSKLVSGESRRPVPNTAARNATKTTRVEGNSHYKKVNGVCGCPVDEAERPQTMGRRSRGMREEKVKSIQERDAWGSSNVPTTMVSTAMFGVGGRDGDCGCGWMRVYCLYG